MSSDDFHAFLRAPGKVLVAVVAIIAGGGSLSLVYNPNDGNDAALAECRDLVDEHAETIISLREEVGSVADLRRLPALDNPFADHTE